MAGKELGGLLSLVLGLVALLLVGAALYLYLARSPRKARPGDNGDDFDDLLESLRRRKRRPPRP